MERESTLENRNSARGKTAVMAVVYPVLALLALLFVFWIGFSSFENNSYEIDRHLYRTIVGQSVSDIESAIRNGKTIESYYGIDKLLLQTTGYIGKDAQAAVTDPSGGILYATFDLGGAHAAIFRTEQVRTYMRRDNHDREGLIVTSGGYELLIQPIYDQSDRHSGNLCLLYPARDPEVYARQNGGMLVMTLIVAGGVMAAMLAWILVTKRVGVAAGGKLVGAVPTIMLTVGILIQSMFCFFTYQTQYKERMLQSARTTCLYMESLVSQAHEKGVPYDKMYGLDEFFADKLLQMPGLWDMKLVRVLADSQDILVRESEYQISAPITDGKTQINMRLDVTISKQYIDRKTAETLLLSLISLIVSMVAIIEITRLPELIMLKMSKDFAQHGSRQYAGTQSGLRLFAFLMYTGVYIVMPFSSMLVRQWRQTMFGLSLDVTAGIPMTAEIFALMVGSLAGAALFKRVKVKIGLGASVALFIASNIACLFIIDPYWLAALRFLSGIGFSGALHTSNLIVTYSADGRSGMRSSTLAGMNAGLLGGIMTGGALGAVIASTMGIYMCFIVAAGLCAAAGVILFTLMPWKMFISRQEEMRSVKGAASAQGRARAGKALLHPKVLLYFLLVMIPLSLGLMFIVAGMPALAQAKGLSPLLLSCGYLANGVAGVYLGTPLLEMLTRKLPGNLLITAVLVVGGIAMSAVFLPPAWITLLICVFLLGIFDGVGTPTVMLMFLELPGIKTMRQVDALTAGNMIMRVVNTAAPVAYGLIIAAAAGSAGIFAIMGGLFVAAGAIYLFAYGGAKKNSEF